MTIRRLFIVYLSALALLFSSVAASMVLTEVAARQLATDGNNINISGRQRMLSQRIIYLAQDLNLRDSATQDRLTVRADLLTAIQELEGAISLFLTSHRALSGVDQLSDTRRSLYFDDLAGTGSLDQRVRLFTQFARRVATDPQDNDALARLIEIERAGLLDDLDAVVSDIEAVSHVLLEQLRQYERATMIIALLLVCIEIIFVFRPGHAMIQRILDQLQARNRVLEATQSQLDAQNQVLRANSATLQSAYADSERLRKEQADFTYAVSHDLKSPANTIHLSLNEMNTSHARDLNADGQELLRVAMDTVTRMGEQIEDILQYAWATDERTPPEITDLNACLTRVCAELSEPIRITKAVIHQGTLPTLFAHTAQIDILLKCLISNALKYHAENRIPEITVSAETLPDGPGILLRVADNGIGIPAKDCEKIFGLFQRLHLRETYPGTGLGLSICTRVAKNHGGRISVTSQVGEGSCFEVVLGEAETKTQIPTLQVAA